MVELRDQMAETTKQINAMTGEYVAMKESAHQYDSLMPVYNKKMTGLEDYWKNLIHSKRIAKK